MIIYFRWELGFLNIIFNNNIAYIKRNEYIKLTNLYHSKGNDNLVFRSENNNKNYLVTQQECAFPYGTPKKGLSFVFTETHLPSKHTLTEVF